MKTIDGIGLGSCLMLMAVLLNVICGDVEPWQQDLNRCGSTFEERFGLWDTIPGKLPRWPLQYGSKFT